MSVFSVKKRNGNIVSFDIGRIENAIQKACISIGYPDTSFVPYITKLILIELEGKYSEKNIPTVENVQDVVEKKLMEGKLFDVAKEYIIYRQRQIDKRTEEMVEKIQKHEISVVKSDGSKEEFDIKKIEETFTRALSDQTKGVDVSELLNSIRTNIYDGISTQEISKAITITTKSFIEKDPAYSFLTAKLFLYDYYEGILGRVSDVKDLEKKYKNAFIDNIHFLVKKDRLSSDLLDFDLGKIADAIDISRDNLFTYLSIQTLYDRYFIHHEKRRLELPQAFWMRVAMGLAKNEKDKEARAIEFYTVLSKLEFVSSTPTLFNSGTCHSQLSSCYLLTVEDDLKNIFKYYGDNAQLSKWAGGLGNDWTNVRALGSYIKGTNGESQGIVPFLKIANDTAVAVNQGGKRKGAMCAYLETWHLDIEDFLDLRRNTGDERRRTHDMNTANWIPDLFMKRVENDEEWTLFSPSDVPGLHDLYGAAFEKRYIEYEKDAKNGKINPYKTIEAKRLWRKMISMLFETGHPWMTWKDACNVRSPQDHAGVVHSSNLCTEITLNTSKDETAVCNLGSVNLSRHLTEDGKIDHKKIEKTVYIAMRMLDNVIDINFYPIPEAKNSNLRHRPVGLGVMGLADCLFALDINFDSEASVKFNDEILENISYHAILASSKIAKEKGTYESYKGSKWDRGIFPIDTLDLLEKERGMKVEVNRDSTLDWEVVREHVKNHGMRNSNTMAIAPTATISNIAGCFPCIEPIYKNLYVKSNLSGEFTIINSYLVQDLKKANLWNQEMINKLKYFDGSIQMIEEIPEKIREKYKEVFEISSEWVVKSAAVRGKWIDQAQSVNIFMKAASGPVLSQTYMDAWKKGLKTTYYLRSLGASAVEKSTLDRNFGKTPVDLEKTSEEKAQEKKVMCSILNGPECESCQ